MLLALDLQRHPPPLPRRGIGTAARGVIVELAAWARRANRDIAAHLLLSPRTIGQHLYKALPKLGISSRTELARLDLDRF
ncbi:LuxR C-terminal-related transcriptional regulator [Micromonospora chersina]|uniref:LuxR C-terminal-related transcriptional regulator n=1 Tax=Micromonospora chersina TaxID=47854 RepID=UPI003714D7D8